MATNNVEKLADQALRAAGWNTRDYRLGTTDDGDVTARLDITVADKSVQAMSAASSLLNALHAAGLTTTVQGGDVFEAVEHVAAGGRVVVYAAE